jgi:hypothetical protein
MSGWFRALSARFRALRRASARNPRPQRRRRGLRPLAGPEGLEPRVLLSTSPHEIYAWSIVNEMRENPPRFADELEGLYRNTIREAHGVKASDPVWTDLRRVINDKNTAHFWEALELMRKQPRLGPLAWEDDLEQRSQDHNTWMESHCYGHSWWYSNPKPGCDGKMPGLSQPGINGDYDRIGPEDLGTWVADANRWAENIAYRSGRLERSASSSSRTWTPPRGSCGTRSSRFERGTSRWTLRPAAST